MLRNIIQGDQQSHNRFNVFCSFSCHEGLGFACARDCQLILLYFKEENELRSVRGLWFSL